MGRWQLVNLHLHCTELELGKEDREDSRQSAWWRDNGGESDGVVCLSREARRQWISDSTRRTSFHQHELVRERGTYVVGMEWMDARWPIHGMLILGLLLPRRETEAPSRHLLPPLHSFPSLGGRRIRPALHGAPPMINSPKILQSNVPVGAPLLWSAVEEELEGWKDTE